MSRIERVPVRTWYLEMKSPPAGEAPPWLPEERVVRAVRPTVAFYRFLYTQAGAGHAWYDRVLMPDDELLGILHDERVEVHVLWVGGVPAGYCELDGRECGEVELAYFGILPEYRGRGYGPRLLQWAVREAWSWKPGRVWVHTCEFDAKAALPMYLRAGFTQYDERIELQRIPAECEQPRLASAKN